MKYSAKMVMLFIKANSQRYNEMTNTAALGLVEASSSRRKYSAASAAGVLKAARLKRILSVTT